LRWQRRRPWRRKKQNPEKRETLEVFMKKVVFLLVLALGFHADIFAQTENEKTETKTDIFWNISGGFSIVSDANYAGVDSRTIIDDGDEGSLKWGSGVAGLISAHIGVGNTKGVSLETGIDYFINNNINRKITWTDYPQTTTEDTITYSSLDIPLLVNFTVGITDNFVIKPFGGMYLSFPHNLNIKQYETGYTQNYNYDKDFDIENGVVFGLELGLKFEYFIKNNGSIYFGANYKRDFVPIYSSAKINGEPYTWNYQIQNIPVYIGFERKF
jgi:hypothetical protein